MMALHLDGKGTELKDVKYDIFSVQSIMHTNNIEIIMLPDGVMYVMEHGLQEGKQRNDLASLIARRDVYGPALIAGFNGDDVPNSYISAYIA